MMAAEGLLTILFPQKDLPIYIHLDVRLLRQISLEIHQALLRTLSCLQT